ncbi:ATP-binding protein [Bradyrhizobium sp. URHD0069]|uniref:sensor histidine kinase n=1 Tax=Bradyrhizobium sp. URHD0069 TaxID=1380355 RepID=UPI00068BED49|nr:ATP-binding protein [Bradyrhizobium sp. URHD0069]
MQQSRLQGKAASIVLPIATAVIAIAVFIADTVTDLEVPFAVMYVVVILLAARFCRARALMLVATGCVGLTVVSDILTPGISAAEGFASTLFSLATILLTTLLALQAQKAAAALQEQANLLDQAHDSIFVRNLNDVITYWNRGAQEQYGWSAEQAIGKSSHELLRTVFPAPLDELRAELLRTGRWEGELHHTRSDGTEVIAASRWSLHLDDREQPVAILETNNDITERIHRENEIRRLNQELEINRLNQALGERAAEIEATNKELESFAYSVSHDLRAPLRHVVGFSELLQRQASSVLDDKSRGYIQTIVDSAKRMGNLIDDLLAFSRIGRAETKKTPVNLEQLVTEVVAELGQETKGRDIVWKINTLPVCYGDRSMLRLVVVNLVSNAVKFTRMRKPATIEIGCVGGSKSEVEFFVKDNGAGFDMRYVNKLFGVFQRLHNLEEFEGTGIGLASVQRIIHRHGGEVRAEGVVDQGATFYFSLPIRKDAAGSTL